VLARSSSEIAVASISNSFAAHRTQNGVRARGPKAGSAVCARRLRRAAPRNLLARERRRLRKNDVGMNPVFRKRIRHLREFLDVLLGDFAAVLAFSDRQSDAVFVETFFRNDHQVRFAGHDFRSGRGDRHRGHVDHTGVQDRIQLLQCQSHRNRALLVILAAE